MKRQEVDALKRWLVLASLVLVVTLGIAVMLWVGVVRRISPELYARFSELSQVHPILGPALWAFAFSVFSITQFLSIRNEEEVSDGTMLALIASLCFAVGSTSILVWRLFA